MSSSLLVFVYGTLKKGGSNHALLIHSACLGAWRTDKAYRLYDLGAYPAVVAGGDSSIHGEVYRVNKATMKRLDQLEDYPELYDRQLIDTCFGKAWIYLMEEERVRHCRQIRDGVWKHEFTASPRKNV